MKQVNDIRALISEFQLETKSNSVLDFGVWIENRFIYLEKLKKSTKKPSASDLAKKIVDDLKTEAKKK